MNKLAINALMGLLKAPRPYKSAVKLHDLMIIASWKKADQCWLTIRTMINLAFWSGDATLQSKALTWLQNHRGSKAVMGTAFYEGMRSRKQRLLVQRHLRYSADSFPDQTYTKLPEVMKAVGARGWMMLPPDDRPDLFGACARLAETPEAETVDHTLVDLLNLATTKPYASLIEHGLFMSALSLGGPKTTEWLKKEFIRCWGYWAEELRSGDSSNTVVDPGVLSNKAKVLFQVVSEKWFTDFTDEEVGLVMESARIGRIGEVIAPLLFYRVDPSMIPDQVLKNVIGNLGQLQSNPNLPEDDRKYLEYCTSLVAALPWPAKRAALEYSACEYRLIYDEKVTLDPYHYVAGTDKEAQSFLRRLVRSSKASPRFLCRYAQSPTKGKLKDVQKWLQECGLDRRSFIHQIFEPDRDIILPPLDQRGEALMQLIRDVVIPNNLSVGPYVLSRWGLVSRLLQTDYRPKTEDLCLLAPFMVGYEDYSLEPHYRRDREELTDMQFDWFADELWPVPQWQEAVWQVLENPPKGYSPYYLLPLIFFACSGNPELLEEKMLPIVRRDSQLLREVERCAYVELNDSGGRRPYNDKGRAAALSAATFLLQERGGHRLQSEQLEEEVWSRIGKMSTWEGSKIKDLMLSLLGKRKVCDWVIMSAAQGDFAEAELYVHLFTKTDINRMRQALLTGARKSSYQVGKVVDWARVLGFEKEPAFQRLLQELLLEASYDNQEKILELIR